MKPAAAKFLWGRLGTPNMAPLNDQVQGSAKLLPGFLAVLAGFPGRAQCVSFPEITHLHLGELMLTKQPY